MAPFHFLLLLLFAASASAIDITSLLSQSPDFSTFSSLLTQTHIADEINRRQTITVLALDNGAVADLSSHPLPVATDILAVHVILDYYDLDKLQKLPKGAPTQFTTLFQATGKAKGKAGFVAATVGPDGSVTIASAEQGASQGSKVVKSVVARPYNISVLQISTAIVPPGIGSGGANGSTSASPPSAKAPAASPTAAPTGSPATKSAAAPGPSNDAATPAASPAGKSAATPAPSADSPAGGSPASSPAAADAPSSSAAGGSAAADAPAAGHKHGAGDAPASGPAGEVAAADSPATSADEPKSSGVRAVLHGGVAVGALALMGLA